MQDVILEVSSLTKYFRSNWIFKRTQGIENVSFDIRRGESFGFLGHNGAGKTTTIKCIVGLLVPHQGSITLNGKPLEKAGQRSLFGYLPEQPYFYDYLTVRETVNFYAGLHALRGKNKAASVNEALIRMKLEDRAKQRVRTLSKGLQQRLGFACAIVNKPELLILDEPFSGLDPIGRMDIRSLLLEELGQGTTIFMSSHILNDVEFLCSRAAIMARGRLSAEIDVKESLRHPGYEIELAGGHSTQSLGLSDSFPAEAQGSVLSPMDPDSEARTNFFVKNHDLAQTLLTTAINRGIKVFSLRPKVKTLEEKFLEVTAAKG